MRKKVLITGGAGFIGSHLVERLYQNGSYDVTVLDNLHPQIHGEDVNSFTYKKIIGKCDFIKGDIQDEKLFKELISKTNILIHLAAETGTGQSMYETSRYVKANCLGTSYIVDQLNTGNHEVTKVIVASSRSIYGEGKYRCSVEGLIYPDSRNVEDMERGEFECLSPYSNEPMEVMPTSEDSRIHPISAYGLTKFFQENLLESTCVALELPFVALRFQNVFGVGQSLSNPYTGIISIFSNRFRKGKGVNIFEDGQESRDFIYISDVIDSIEGSINIEKKDPLILNVGSGKMTSVLEVAEILKAAINPSVEIKITGEFRKGDIRHNYADLTQIREVLSFEPKVGIVEGLGLFAKWMLNESEEEDFYEESLKELKDKGLLG
jgi:dTDP-L-rhamnose 4-epimerase